jgi:hypothetical protein
MMMVERPASRKRNRLGTGGLVSVVIRDGHPRPSGRAQLGNEEHK